MKKSQLRKIIKEQVAALMARKNQPQKKLIKEEPEEWWCNCANDEGCWGTIDFDDESSNCACCDELSPCPDDRIEKPIKRDKQLRR